MLRTEENRYALTSDEGAVIGVYAKEDDARTDGKWLAEKEGVKVLLRELKESATEEDVLVKRYSLLDTFEPPAPQEEKKEEPKAEDKAEDRVEEEKKEGPKEEPKAEEKVEEKVEDAGEAKSEGSGDSGPGVTVAAGGEKKDDAGESKGECCPACGNLVLPGAEICSDCGCNL